MQFQELREERKMLLTSNRSLAEDSLTRRPRLCDGKFQLARKYRELSDLAAACWEKQSQLGELVGWAEDPGRPSPAAGFDGQLIMSDWADVGFYTTCTFARKKMCHAHLTV